MNKNYLLIYYTFIFLLFIGCRDDNLNISEPVYEIAGEEWDIYTTGIVQDLSLSIWSDSSKDARVFFRPPNMQGSSISRDSASFTLMNDTILSVTVYGEFRGQNDAADSIYTNYDFSLSGSFNGGNGIGDYVLKFGDAIFPTDSAEWTGKRMFINNEKITP